MDTNFLLEQNWPSFGQGNHSAASVKLHEWCGNISKFLLALHERVTQLEAKDVTNSSDIQKLNEDLNLAKNSVQSSSISNKWVQVVTKGARNAKKPAEQLVVANTTINELNKREKRKKNLIIYSVTESNKTTLIEKKAEDEQKLESIFTAIGKSDVKPAYSTRLKSRDLSKPAPILVELVDVSIGLV